MWSPVFKHFGLPTLPVAIGLVLIGMVMFAQASGDSNLVGFFKQVKDSRFARLDTWAYSPLCVVLGAGLLAVAWI